MPQQLVVTWPHYKKKKPAFRRGSVTHWPKAANLIGYVPRASIPVSRYRLALIGIEKVKNRFPDQRHLMLILTSFHLDS
jgi:hypothetical protein